MYLCELVVSFAGIYHAGLPIGGSQCRRCCGRGQRHPGAYLERRETHHSGQSMETSQWYERRHSRRATSFAFTCPKWRDEAVPSTHGFAVQVQHILNTLDILLPATLQNPQDAGGRKTTVRGTVKSFDWWSDVTIAQMNALCEDAWPASNRRKAVSHSTCVGFKISVLGSARVDEHQPNGCGCSECLRHGEFTSANDYTCVERV